MTVLDKKKVIIIGGGAAGFFAANQIIEQTIHFEIVILEQGQKVLQKVKVSGGGRCNVTNANIQRENLPDYYPRGWKLLRKLFSIFDNKDVVNWFLFKGIVLKTEMDQRMFPTTDQSQTIIDGLLRIQSKSNVEIFTSCKVLDFKFMQNQWEVITNSKGKLLCDYLLIASGSSQLIYTLLKNKGVNIVPPVPSLFTFNIPNELRLNDIPGISVPAGRVKIVGDKLVSTGPLLITHWGLSGPAILKLSSWAAIKLHELNYEFTISVNWVDLHIDDCKTALLKIKEEHGNKKVINTSPFNLPKRLWKKFTDYSKISPDANWKEISIKHINTLADQLTNSIFMVKGKSTFKEEFVTCGGVELSDIDSKTLKHKSLKNVYFAGEVMNIDGITGGYNFQAAWTTAYVAAQAIINESIDNVD